MKPLPESEIYEEGLQFWPYQSSLKAVLDEVTSRAPQNGTLVDLMCGPGFLIGQLEEARRDLTLLGVDIDKRYIDYASEKSRRTNFEEGNILTWSAFEKFDVVTCTGSLHHIPYSMYL